MEFLHNYSLSFSPKSSYYIRKNTNSNTKTGSITGICLVNIDDAERFMKNRDWGGDSSLHWMCLEHITSSLCRSMCVCVHTYTYPGFTFAPLSYNLNRWTHCVEGRSSAREATNGIRWEGNGNEWRTGVEAASADRRAGLWVFKCSGCW